MSHAEAVDQYAKALKLGQKSYRSCVLHGRYPYPQVLDEILDNSMAAGRVELGVVEIPTEQIVGTKAAGRRPAFAANFMPLLPQDSEFGRKWVDLCAAHLGDEGIRDPIRCYEYLGRFYVQEGNKRVSVLKSYSAPTIPGYVIRVIPVWSQDLAVQIYYEFMQFYQLSGLYQVQFTRLGRFAKLQAALDFEPGHIWSQEERRSFLSGFSRFRDAFLKQGGESLPITAADALLVWLQVYPFPDLKSMSAAELAKSLTAIWPDVKLLGDDTPIAVSTAPQEQDKGLVSRLFTARPGHLNVAFVNAYSPEESTWTRAHDLGRIYLEQALGEKVTVRVYQMNEMRSAEAVMEQAVEEGAQVLFATTPPLIGACRKIAARHPGLRVLNCSLSMPYTGVRTYYSRIYEATFVTGAVAAAVAREDVIGYVANYPIFGVPASINAFALGARMVNPRVRIKLHWSCTPGDPVKLFTDQGIRVISNRDIPAAGQSHLAWECGAYQVQDDGTHLPLAAPCWEWGKFYEKVIQSILDGTWDALNTKEGTKAVNYWWGLNSGVIDVQLSDTLPDGVHRLAALLCRSLQDGSLDPFHCLIVSQDGAVRNDGEKWLTPEEIMDMDWLCDCVDGSIPRFEELLPFSQNTVRLLGIYRDQIPPEKEGVLP